MRAGVRALGGVLAILFLLRAREEPSRGLAQAAVGAIVLVVLAGMASTSDAVAKPAFLSWQTWDPYDRPDRPGLRLLRLAGELRRHQVPGEGDDRHEGQGLGPEALALLAGDDARRLHRPDLGRGPPARRARAARADRRRGAAAARGRGANEEDWVRQDFTDRGAPRHASARLGPAGALAARRPRRRWPTPPATSSSCRTRSGATSATPPGATSPTPNPSELNTFRGDYPAAAERYLEVVYQPVPEWGTPNRDTLMAVFLGAPERVRDHGARAPLPGRPRRSPAARSRRTRPRRSWRRGSARRAGSRYDEQPPAPVGGVPPLVAFVDTDKRGYCQHYAGAMALMLRCWVSPPVSRSASRAASTTRATRSGRHRHQRARLGRGLVPRLRLAPVRPDPGARPADGDVRALSRARSTPATRPTSASPTGSEGISPAQAEALRAAAERPGLQGTGIGSGSSGTFTVVRDKGPSIFVLVVLVLGGAFAAIVALKAVRRSARFAPRDPRALASACRRDARRLPGRPGRRPAAERDDAGDRRDARALLLDRRRSVRPRRDRGPLRAA